MSGDPAGPRVGVGRDRLRIEDARLFGADADSHTRRFLRRVLAFPGVAAVAVRPAEGAATLHFEVGDGQREDFLARLIEAVRGGEELPETQLPLWPRGEPLTLYRYGELISTFEVVSARGGRLQLRHPAILHDAVFARRVETSLRTLPGVREAEATRSSGKLWVSFDAGTVGARELIRAAETAAAPAATPLPARPSKPVDFRLANTSVGLATVGEFLVPVATPLCVGLLVVTHADRLREAASQLRRGKLGTPVWMTALLACSIASGQVLAYALTDWSFRYWTRRWHRDVATESQLIPRETVPVPSHVRLTAGDGTEVLTPAEDLIPGQSLTAAAGEVVAVDGRVTSGVALVHETPLSGARSSVRKRPGDPVYAGSTLLEGRITIEVQRTGNATRAAEISRAVLRAATALPEDRTVARAAVSLVDRTVPPTLATAAVGLLLGDLFTVGAILHQDWLSGAELAVPLETLRDLRLAAESGAIVTDPGAFRRLAESRFLVLEDQAALHRRQLALHALRSSLPDTGTLLSHVAGAGLYLGDERAAALASACRDRGLLVRQPELVAMEPEAVIVRAGRHRIVLRGAGPEDFAHLSVIVDETEVAWLEFRRTQALRARETVGRLRALGFQVFLASDRPEAEAAALANALGTPLFGGDLGAEQKRRFLRGLRRRGIRPAWVGHGETDPTLRAEAPVFVSLAGAPPAAERADIVLLGESLEPLVEVAGLSGENGARIRRTCRTAAVPNLLCVAGGFAGLLNGITAGILANLAVSNVYRAATASLHTLPRKAEHRITI